VCSNRFLDRGPVVAACEGNNIFRTDSSRKAGHGFIVSSIRSCSTWELLLKFVYQQQFRGITVVDISISATILPMNRC
jgi:hypothetical protein